VRNVIKFLLRKYKLGYYQSSTLCTIFYWYWEKHR